MHGFKGMRSKRNKFGNKRTEFDGKKFASKKEARRYSMLKAMEARGLIKDLKCQVRFTFKNADGIEIRHVPSNRVVTYVADFTYFDERWKLVVEDSKGMRTPDYKLKAAMMKWLNGITILET